MCSYRGSYILKFGGVDNFTHVHIELNFESTTLTTAHVDLHH